MKLDTHLLLLFIVLLAFPQLSETLITPALPSIANGLQTDSHMAEMSVSVFFTGFALGVSFWGILADRLGRRPAMLLGLLVYIIGSVECGLSMSIAQLLMSTFIQALGASCGSVITQTMLRDICEDKERARIFAIIGMSLSFSPALGPLIGCWLDLHLGWRANYVSLFLLGLFLLGWAYVKLIETLPKHIHNTSSRELLKLGNIMLRDPFVWACSSLIGLCNGIIFSFFAEGPYIFIENLKIEPGIYGWIGIIVSLSTFASGYISRRYIHRWEPEDLIKLGAMAMGIGSLLYLAVSTIVSFYNLIGLEAALMLIAPLFLVFLGLGMIISNTISIALKNYRGCLGSAGSMLGFSYYVVIAALTGVMSLIHDGTIMPLPMFVVFMSMASFAIAIKLKGLSAITLKAEI